jgi:hypothetical protein
MPGPENLSAYFVTPILQVLYANAHPSMSHVSPDFAPVFGDCIRMIRQGYAAGSSVQLEHDKLTRLPDNFFTQRTRSRS